MFARFMSWWPGVASAWCEYTVTPMTGPTLAIFLLCFSVRHSILYQHH